jgi:hypothetical protein
MSQRISSTELLSFVAVDRPRLQRKREWQLMLSASYPKNVTALRLPSRLFLLLLSLLLSQTKKTKKQKTKKTILGMRVVGARNQVG